jgi:hypothetical protein
VDNDIEPCFLALRKASAPITPSELSSDSSELSEEKTESSDSDSELELLEEGERLLFFLFYKKVKIMLRK